HFSGCGEAGCSEVSTVEKIHAVEIPMDPAKLASFLGKSLLVVGRGRPSRKTATENRRTSWRRPVVRREVAGARDGHKPEGLRSCSEVSGHPARFSPSIVSRACPGYA